MFLCSATAMSLTLSAFLFGYGRLGSVADPAHFNHLAWLAELIQFYVSEDLKMKRPINYRGDAR
jgi:hypothetical protein